MSRLYWSNLPDAKSPRGGTSTLCSSLTTEDLPIPEYPETSTSSGAPLLMTRSKPPSKVSSSRARPYSFSGIRSRSGERELVDVILGFPLGQAAPQIARHASRRLVALLGSLGEQFHDDGRDRG